MSNLPPIKILVNGKHVDLLKDDRLQYENLLGRCEWSSQRVTYASNQAPQTLVDTILHEVVHFISKETDIDLSERQTGVITSMLLGFMSTNPEFIEWAAQTWVGKTTKTAADCEADSAGDYK